MKKAKRVILPKAIATATDVKGRVVEWSVPCQGTCEHNCTSHKVWRMGSCEFACDCPAGSYRRLCKHVKAAIKQAVAGTLAKRASVFTDMVAAKRQRRPVVEVIAYGQPLYVTLRRRV